MGSPKRRWCASDIYTEHSELKNYTWIPHQAYSGGMPRTLTLTLTLTLPLILILILTQGRAHRSMGLHHAEVRAL